MTLFQNPFVDSGEGSVAADDHARSRYGCWWPVAFSVAQLRPCLPGSGASPWCGLRWRCAWCSHWWSFFRHCISISRTVGPDSWQNIQPGKQKLESNAIIHKTNSNSLYQAQNLPIFYQTKLWISTQNLLKSSASVAESTVDNDTAKMTEKNYGCLTWINQTRRSSRLERCTIDVERNFASFALTEKTPRNKLENLKTSEERQQKIFQIFRVTFARNDNAQIDVFPWRHFHTCTPR